MGANKNKQGRKCFIITPIGDGSSTIYRKAKGVIESVIKPVLIQYGFDDVKPAYEINISGMINTQIINRIIDDDLVIANLTGNNPNVMYELCLRHVVAKPVIHICENGTQLPFDIKDNRTIFYENDMLGVDELKNKLQDFVKEIEYDKECLDNPVYSAYRMKNLLKTLTDAEDNNVSNVLSKILDEISDLKDKSYEQLVSSTQRVELNDNAYTADEKRLIASYRIRRKEAMKEMKVWQLAKKLGTTGENIINIGSRIGLNLSSHESIINSDDVYKIIDLVTVMGY